VSQFSVSCSVSHRSLKYFMQPSFSSHSIHQSCPRCGKPIQQTTDASNGADGTIQVTSSARQACKNCRRRVGMCFLCHQPVQGVFVWCPGCGHGGHLEHALQWFGGGQGGKAVREMCPTGCGHRCNLVQMASAFPRTDSFTCLPLPSTTAEFSLGTAASETPRNAR
jgi:Zinc-ribbon, C4HC2 type